MVLATIMVALLALTQTVAPATVECVPSSPTPAMAQLCLADTAFTRAAAATAETERTREFETAADRYRRASDLGTSDVQVRALSRLAEVFDADRLNDPGRREGVLRELIALVPDDPRFAFELATFQESQGLIEASEDILLTARRAHPTNVEAYRRLAQFYARRRQADPDPDDGDGAVRALNDHRSGAKERLDERRVAFDLHR